MLEPEPPEGAPNDSLSMVLVGSEGLHEFIRYGVASGLALAVDVSLLWLGTSYLGISYLISGALSFLAGLVVIYILSVHWVFLSRSLSDPTAEFLVFSAIGVTGLLVNEVILYFLTDILGAFYLVSKTVSVAAVFVWNFSMRKTTLFRSRV